MGEKFMAYYQLTKPGVLYGNILTGVAGYFLASAGEVNWLLFISVIFGMTLIVASACVINNYLDRDIDSIMERTKSRPSVRGVIKPTYMVAYGIVLFVIGMAILFLYTNILVVAIGIIGFITYVWMYGAWSKRQSIHGTLVGSISGAMPIAGGYAAVSGSVNAGLIIAFLIMFFWQFPEFYSIAIYRRKEYAAAHIPVMSVVKGIRSTTIQIYIYTTLYVVSTLLLTIYGYTGITYLIIMTIAGGYWVYLAGKGFRTKNPEAWARKMFRFSMISVLLLCIMLTVGPLLP
ncbi:MAG: heme o synthase [Candidatus Saccharimonadales bacterium]